MKKRLEIYNKVLIIIGFILIAIFNFCFTFQVVGIPQCKHDLLIGTLKTAARLLEYIGLIVGIIFVMISKYKDKKFSTGIKIIILVALIIPLILSVSATIIRNNDSCTVRETQWETISSNTQQ